MIIVRMGHNHILHAVNVNNNDKGGYTLKVVSNMIHSCSKHASIHSQSSFIVPSKKDTPSQGVLLVAIMILAILASNQIGVVLV
jgi:hypothetical protein